MSIPVKLKNIIDALDAGTESIILYLDKRTGRVEMISEDITAGTSLDDDETLEDSPEWLREAISKAREIENDKNNNFVELPTQHDINEYEIMKSFSRTYPNSRVSAALQDAIRNKGAFRRFKNLLVEFAIEESWYDFKRDAYEEIAIDWLEANEIPYTRGDEIEVSGEM